MSDIKKKVENTKVGKVEAPVSSTNEGKIEVNWGNAEKIKILMLQAINNNLVELIKLMKDVKDSK